MKPQNRNIVSFSMYTDYLLFADSDSYHPEQKSESFLLPLLSLKSHGETDNYQIITQV
jgi:hypothetical protein